MGVRRSALVTLRVTRRQKREAQKLGTALDCGLSGVVRLGLEHVLRQAQPRQEDMSAAG